MPAVRERFCCIREGKLQARHCRLEQMDLDTNRFLIASGLRLWSCYSLIGEKRLAVAAHLPTSRLGTVGLSRWTCTRNALRCDFRIVMTAIGGLHKWK